MTEALAEIGHNNPPDAIDEATAPYSDSITEAESWLDGDAVTNEAQLKAVDALTKDIKAAIKAVEGGEEAAAKPLYKAWKAEKDRWKPTIDDLTRIRRGLVAIAGDFKKKLAAEKAEAERKAQEEAWRKTREAEEASRKAQAGNIGSVRAAAAAQAEAEAAQKVAMAKAKDTVKGMREVTKFAIDDHRAALNWIARNDREAMTAFIEEYVRKNHKAKTIDGVRVWQDKEAF